jgi:very-short-patch-repair endonuclease/DNA polymerase III delta prime subunit
MPTNEDTHPQRFTGNYNGEIELEYLPCVNYAMIHNHIAAFKFCTVKNTDDKDWKMVKLSIDGEYIKSNETIIDTILSGQIIQVNTLKLTTEVNKLIELTEGIDTFFNFTLTVDGYIAFEYEYSFHLMAFDQWTGTSILPELLASFVTPNHPMLSRVSVKASSFLNKWTGNSALDEYQTENPNRVRLQIAAIYEALRSEALVYCAPPASFEAYGQRIRLVDKVLSEKLGTCIDLTLLFASCLEANGIHPLLIVLKGHIFVGAWLINDIYSKEIGDDASFLLKSCADGVSEIVLVESTALTSSESISFEDAVLRAENEIKQEGSFEFFIDIFRCRLDDIRPLPIRINKDGVWQVQNEGLEHKNATTTVTQLNHYDLKFSDSQQTITRQTIWERKLLDFSLRNNLINTKIGRRVIPFISFDIDHLEDHLQAGENYQILPSPTKSKIESSLYGIYDSALYKSDLSQLVVNELQNKRIFSYLTDAELQESLKYVYRTSRTALEENGANSLFLALGLLKWYETEKSEKPRFAPILLLPVDIIRRGGTLGYVIRTRDEDIMLNITLVELLKQQYHILLKGLDPLPKDDSGVDVKLIFTIIRDCIKEIHGWNVLEESMLGLFSFNKFVMWNDIHNNADKLKENKIIASLLENRIQWTNANNNIDARYIDKTCEPKDFAIPVDVDSSQMEAVVESGEGKSFILHGPPGTGKSQTITNMIANALYKGKRVLFVAEKMAALSVVQTRLEKIGLAPFCLEMHSNKATKSHFLEQLQQAINIVHIQSPTEYEKLSAELYECRQQLIGYMEALHKPHTSGLSLYECITNYLYIEGDEVAVCKDLLKDIDKDWLLKTREALTSLDTVFLISGHPLGNPLSGIYPKDSSREALTIIHNLLERVLSFMEKVSKAKTFFAKNIGIEIVQDNLYGYTWMRNMCNALLSLEEFNKSLLEAAGNMQLANDWIQTIACGKERDNIRNTQLKDYREEILRVNASELRQEWQTIGQKWFISRFFAKHSYLKRLRMYRSDMDETLVIPMLNSLDIYHKLNLVITNHSKEISNTFGILGSKDKEKWDDMLKALNNAKVLYQLLIDYAKANDSNPSLIMTRLVDYIGPNWSLFRQTNNDLLQSISSHISEFHEIWKKLGELCYITLPDNQLETTLPPLLQRWLNHFDSIIDWYQWCSRRKEMIDTKLDVAVEYIEKGHTGVETAEAVTKGIYHQLTMEMVDSDEALRLFNGLLFEDIIKKYRQTTTSFQELTKKELYARLASRIPSLMMEAASSSEVGILKRNIANGGRGMSIRRIIDQIPTLLSKLCPCMLMSPISVAQFVDLNTDKFDLVIFDEASQMPTSEAVGAIARGNALVVVGDPKQMPPTNFFSSSQVDDDEAELDDMESILDDCISLSMPSHYLTWHYRSKHESLITFSNMNYYGGKLFTFPSVDDRTSKVSIVHINGIYDKGRTRSNRAEASAIVAEIMRRLRDEQLSQHSIGVVSFSQVQQNLIEDMLMDELSKYPELEKIALQGNEPIFIKNLENVQGDERDVILFSIGYGPDKNGNVSINFGPLNNKGGERRLNVAVSRARYEMIVYSTLYAEQIDLKRTKSKGVEGLKNFLAYAEHGIVTIPSTSISVKDKRSLITLIANEIEKFGYKVDTQVGNSNFKVDIAIIDPSNSNRYLLGILCDGKNYYETKTTRDREIVQPSVLTMLHWQVMRIWSVDWYENKEKVISRIVSRLDAIKSGSIDEQRNDLTLISNAKSSFSINNEPVVKQTNEIESEYVFADIESVYGNSDIDTVMMSSQDVSHQLNEIISVEQPITNTLLYKRISHIWNISRVTIRLQHMIDFLLSPYYRDKISDTQIVYWTDIEKSNNYKIYRINSKRDILDIPIIEVMNAAQYVVSQQMSLHKEDLKRLTSQVLGFNRMGANLESSIEYAINKLISLNRFVDREGLIMDAE